MIVYIIMCAIVFSSQCTCTIISLLNLIESATKATRELSEAYLIHNGVAYNNYYYVDSDFSPLLYSHISYLVCCTSRLHCVKFALQTEYAVSQPQSAKNYCYRPSYNDFDNY